MVSQPQVNIEDRPAVTIAGIEIKATDDSQCPSAWVKLLTEWLLKRSPANRYAVVRIAGPVPESIHHAWCYLWQTYFLENRLTHTGATDLEAYGPGDPNAPDYQMEL